MLKSKTKIEEQLKKKTNPALVKTVILAKKNPAWIELAGLLTTPDRLRRNVNLSELNKTEANIVVVPGKVLSDGEISKKIEVVAFSFSKKAEEKLNNAGCVTRTLMEEIEKNKDAKGVLILK